MNNKPLADYLKEYENGDRPLSRKKLKELIHELERQEKKSIVIVETAKTVDEGKYLSKFQSLFPGKKIKFIVNQNLIFGIRITDDDNVYELNLDDSFRRTENYLREEL